MMLMVMLDVMNFQYDVNAEDEDGFEGTADLYIFVNLSCATLE